MPPMQGLLDNEESLAPSMGLLSAFQSASPQQQLATIQAMHPSAPPAFGASGPTPPAASPSPAANVPLARTPEPMDPLKAGIVSGGLQLLQDSSQSGPGPAPTIGAMISRALAAGLPAFVASKQAKETRKIEIQRQGRYQGMLDEMVKNGTLKPEQAQLAKGFDADTGMKYLEELQKEQNKITVVGKDAVRGDGTVVHTDHSGNKFTEVNGQLVEVGDDGHPVLDNGKVRVVADLRTKPDIHMSDEQAGIARSLKLDPNAVANWSLEETKRFNAELFRQNTATAPKTTINLSQDAFAKGVGEEGVKALASSLGRAQAAVEDLPLIARARDELKNGIYSGTGAAAETKIGQLLNKLGLTDDPRAANTRAYMIAAAARILPIAKTMGAGSGFSDTDRDFLLGIKGGDVTIGSDKLLHLLDLDEKAAHAIVSDHKTRLQKVREAKDESGKPKYAPEALDWLEPGASTDAASPPAGGSAKPVTGKGMIGGKPIELEQIGGKWYYHSGTKSYPYDGPVSQ